MASDRAVREVCRSALGLTAASCIQSVLLVLFVLLVPPQAQQPSIRPYESEEDLWEALNDGEITFDEFVELLDLARAGDDSLLVPPSDWEALPGSEAGYLGDPNSTQPLTIMPSANPSRMDVPWVSAIRVGVDADLSDLTGSDGYSVVRLQQGDWRGVLDFEHDRDDGGTWRRRSLVWQPKQYAIVLGNFEPRWGRGLVVGRRSRVIGISEVSGSFLQPTRGRFNGAWIATDLTRQFSFQGIYSIVRGDSLLESFGALRSELRLSEYQLGMSLSSGGFRHDRSQSERFGNYWTNIISVAGVDFRARSENRELLGELAIQSGGATAKSVELLWPLAKGRFHARLWSYGVGFVNPWGGGPGHSDTRETVLESIDHPFYSRTAGERGFDFTTRLKVTPDMNLRWEWMSHREEPGAKLEHSGVFRSEIRQPGFRTTPFVRARVDEDETEAYSIGNYLWWGPDNRELNLRLEFGTHYDDEIQFVRAGIGAKLQLNHIVRLAPALRWVDPRLDTPSDGYWYFYFTETVLPVAGARVEMALVWKKYEAKSSDDLVELRVRGFVK